MAELSEVVVVNIDTTAQQPSQQGFGIPLILASHTRFTDIFREYASTAEMVSDGFQTWDAAFRAASAVFAQNPRPERVVVGRLPTPSTPHTVEISVNGAVGRTARVTVTEPATGAVTELAVPWATSDTATATALASAIDGVAGLSASAASGVVTAVADANGEVFGYSGINATDSAIGSFQDVTASWGYGAILPFVLDATKAFYAVVIDVDSEANVLEVAAWAETNRRLYFAAPQVVAPGDYAAGPTLDAASRRRTVSLLHGNDLLTHPAAAWLGRMLPEVPGSATYALKSLSGVVPDRWSTTSKNAIEAFNGNHYQEISGIGVTRPGVAANGEFIDAIVGADWIEARIGERVFAVLVNANKVPYTDAGLSVIRNTVRGVLEDAATNGVLDADSIVVTTPASVLDIPEANRAARNLVGVSFTARGAGAFHTINIDGSVTV